MRLVQTDYNQTKQTAKTGLFTDGFYHSKMLQRWSVGSWSTLYAIRQHLKKVVAYFYA